MLKEVLYQNEKANQARGIYGIQEMGNPTGRRQRDPPNKWESQRPAMQSRTKQEWRDHQKIEEQYLICSTAFRENS
jgi:hypothetical protein